MKNITTTITIFFFIISSFIVSLIILLDYQKPYYFNYLPLLPIVFSFLCMLYHRMFFELFNNLGLLVLIGGYYIRFVLTPLIICLADYFTKINLNIEQNLPVAIFLMMYEIIIVFTVMYIAINRKVKINGKKKIKLLSNNNNQVLKIFGTIIIITMVVDIIALILIPELRLMFVPLFSFDGVYDFREVKIDFETAFTGWRRIILIFVQNSVTSIRLFVFAYILNIIAKKISNTYLCLLLSFVVIGINFLFTTSVTALSLFFSVVLIFYLIKLYPTYKNIILRILVFFSLLFAGMILYAKSSLKIESNLNVNIFEELSITLQNYFSGPANVAAVFNIPHDNKLITLFYDIFTVIPVIDNFIFGDRLVILYNNYNNIKYAIIPAVGQSYFYFTYIFAPLLPAAFAYLAVYYGKKLQSEQTVWRFLTYGILTVLLSVTPTAYNFTITFQLLILIVLPMYILDNLSKNTRISDIRGKI